MNIYSKRLLILFFCMGALVYLIFPSNSSIKVPLKLLIDGALGIETKINGKPCLLKVDLGCRFPLVIPSSNLAKIPKCPERSYVYHDIFGNPYKAQGYVIPRLEIDKIKLKRVIAVEKLKKYEDNTTVWCDEKIYKTSKLVKSFGLIGRGILERYNLYFDFLNSYMIISKNKNCLKSYKITLDRFLKVPFKKTKFGIVLSIDTDLGIKDFLLDTGSSLSCLNISDINEKKIRKDNEYGDLPYFLTEKFKISGIDFGVEKLYSIKISSQLDNIKGILGIKFLAKHQIYIDYQNQILYIN